MDADGSARPASRSKSSEQVRDGRSARLSEANEGVHWRAVASALVAHPSTPAQTSTVADEILLFNDLRMKSRLMTASARIASSLLGLVQDNDAADSLRLRREGVSAAGVALRPTVKFSSLYYETLARVIEMQAKALPLSSHQVLSGIKMTWTHAPAVHCCLHAALQLEAACAPSGLPLLSRESCVEVISCCLKWMRYVHKIDEHAPVSEIRRAIIAVCDSIFIEVQPAAWRVSQPASTVASWGLLDVAPQSPASAPNGTATSNPSPSGVFEPSGASQGVWSEGTYVFRSDVLVKKKLSADSLPLWLERCSDERLLEAASSCPTYFEVCQQFAKQELHSRETCSKMISEVRKLQERVAQVCREEDAAVRHAFELDWEKSNLFRNVELMRDDLTNKQNAFDASLDDMIRQQNELLKQVQEVCRRLYMQRASHVHFRPSSAFSACEVCMNTAAASPRRSLRWYAGSFSEGLFLHALPLALPCHFSPKSSSVSLRLWMRGQISTLKSFCRRSRTTSPRR